MDDSKPPRPDLLRWLPSASSPSRAIRILLMPIPGFRDISCELADRLGHESADVWSFPTLHASFAVEGVPHPYHLRRGGGKREGILGRMGSIGMSGSSPSGGIPGRVRYLNKAGLGGSKVRLSRLASLALEYFEGYSDTSRIALWPRRYLPCARRGVRECPAGSGGIDAPRTTLHIAVTQTTTPAESLSDRRRR